MGEESSEYTKADSTDDGPVEDEAKPDREEQGELGDLALPEKHADVIRGGGVNDWAV